MAKNKNTIFWIIGIVVLVLLLSKFPAKFPFAIVTKITCQDNTISYWELDGNVLDVQGINNGINHGVLFVPGKLGQAARFDTLNYIDFPTISDVNTTIMWIKDYSNVGSDWYFVAKVNNVNYYNGILGDTKQIIPLGSTFGLGLNGSVDEIAVFDRSLSSGEIYDLYSNPKKICYTISMEENVTCKDFATEQAVPQATGCLEYSGGFFPNCSYSWLSQSGFYISGSQCLKRFYCEDILAVDYSSLTACQNKLNVTTPTTPPGPDTTEPETTEPGFTTTATTTPPDNCVYTLFGFCITWTILIVVIVSIGIIVYYYYLGKK